MRFADLHPILRSLQGSAIVVMPELAVRMAKTLGRDLKERSHPRHDSRVRRQRNHIAVIEDDRFDQVRERHGIVLAWIHDKGGSCATEWRAGQDKDANTYVIEISL